VAHFRRRFVGKGHRHNRIRRRVFHHHQPCDTVNQHTRLTAARARQHQHIAARRCDGVALFIIEAIKQVRNVHWYRRERGAHAPL